MEHVLVSWGQYCQVFMFSFNTQFQKTFFYFKKVSLNFMTVLRDPYQPVSRPDGEKSPNETGKRWEQVDMSNFFSQWSLCPRCKLISCHLLFLDTGNGPLNQIQKGQVIQPRSHRELRRAALHPPAPRTASKSQIRVIT